MDEQLLAGQVPAADTASETPETPPTVTVVDVHFRSGGKNYYFDPRDLPIETGDHLIIETAQGMEFGYCSAGAHAVSASSVPPASAAAAHFFRIMFFMFISFLRKGVKCGIP